MPSLAPTEVAPRPPASSSTKPPASFPLPGLSTLLMHVWEHLREEQLDHGEFPTFCTGHAFHPYRTCLLSALIHEAFSAIDPRAPGFDHLVLEAAPQLANQLVRRTMELRRTIRGFLAWQEDGLGGFRLQGKSSTLDPDLATTALAALALSESSSANPRAQRRRAECITALASPPSDANLMGLTNAVRFLARAGRPSTELANALNSRVLEWSGSSDSGFRVEACYWALARLFREEPGQLSRECWEAIHGLLLSACRNEVADSPLASSLLLLALTDFETEPDVMKQLLQRLLRSGTESGWHFEPFFNDGQGSPALVTAFALAAVLRATARVFES